MKLHKSFFVLVVLLVAGATGVVAQTRVITGQVVDATTNMPLDGATVTVRGTVLSTVTGADGNFTLTVSTGPVQLLVRQIGYQRAESLLGANTNTVTFRLTPDVLQLDEIVVTGQATGIDRRNLANAVATVSAQEVQRVPAASVERAIRGKIAGANIQSNSGAPGGGIQVELRGVTSINGDAQPIYVVDGIIVSDVAIPSNINEVTDASGGSNPGLTQDNQVNRIVDLNPADIESVEILKGASASAIYGSKASNGVIIIQTKRGRGGAPRVNVSQRFGTRDLANTLTREFATAADVDAAFGAGTAAANDFDPDRNWERDLAGRNPLSYESLVSVSGGTDDTQYFISGLWRDEEGVMSNTGFDKQSLRVNLDQALGNRLTLQVSSSLLHSLARRGISNNDNTGTSPWFAGASTPRFVNLEAGPDGVFPDNPFERSNPLQTLSLMTNDEDVWRFMGAARLEWNAVQGDRHNFRFIGSAGVDRFSQKNELLFPPELQFEDDDGLPGTSLLSNSDNENINLNGNVVYSYAPLDGSFMATTSGGVQFDTRDLNIARITTRNLLAGQNNINQGSVIGVDERRQRIEDLGFYLQEEVLIGDRLLLTAGVRADQSSVNTADDELFFYPKGAASYRFTLGSGFINELKLRAAYGESGNQPLFGQKFSPLEGTVNIESILGFQVPPGTGVNGATVVVSDIKPERQREIEGGADMTFADGRANLEATVYHKEVSDLLLQRQLAPSSGFVQEIFNGGTMRVRGIEAALGVAPIQSADVSWVFRSTFSLNRSKITSLPVPSFFPNNAGFGAGFGNGRIEEGESATQLAGNIPDGQGGATIGKVGDTNPDFRMSLTNDVSVGRFSLGFLLDWQQGSQIVNLTRLLFDAGNNSKDCTTGPDNPCAQRLGAFGTDLSVYVEDATYLKLREINVSYDIPPSITQSLWGAISNARLTASARNWLTFTGYTGMDPEVSNFGNQAVGRNIDVAPYPRTRSFWFGLDLGF